MPPVGRTSRATIRRRAETPARVASRIATPLVLVALSGGADSLALAAATAFEAPRAGLRAGAVIVDHGLQDASADVAAAASDAGARPRARPRASCVASTSRGEGGPEACRSRRPATPHSTRPPPRPDAALVLLGHTLDDQAETVLLGLARGSGAASLAGHGPRDPDGTRGRCSASGARPRGRRASTPDSRRGTTRTTSTAPSPACACASACCPCSRPSSARASPRRSRAPPSSCVKTTRRSRARSTSSSRSSANPPRRASRVSVGALAANPAALRQRHHPARRSRASSASRSRARRRSRSRGSSPTGTARGRSTCPAAVRATRAGRHVVFSTTGSTEVLPHDH